MNDYDIVILFIGFLSYAAAIVQGVTTMGDAIAVHAGWRIAVLLAPKVMASTPYGEDHLLGVTIMLSIRSFVVQIYFAYRSRKLICLPLLKVALPASLVTMALGAVVLDQYHASWWLSAVVGSIFGVFAAVFLAVNVAELVKNRREGTVKHLAAADFELTTRVKVWIGIATAASGFLAGVVGVGAPPMIVAALLLDIPQEILRGVLPFVWMGDYIIRFFGSWMLGRYDGAAWMLYFAISLGAVAGLHVGIELGQGLPHDMFVVFVCWLLLFAAISIAQLPGLCVLVAVVLCAASFGVLYFVSGPPMASPLAGDPSDGDGLELGPTETPVASSQP